ncbi:hypothetical protein XmelCFBP4644_02825 [Xanthomonas melonis]|uniref:Uncharacterized protein n=1 Tax=Xanthomonas melonis TaxID=56456 RepID=A0A2S7DLX9_9XANT|nr:hypothetical protein XmelCFBP4644_02825 [Xanthomonas melonis]
MPSASRGGAADLQARAVRGCDVAVGSAIAMRHAGARALRRAGHRQRPTMVPHFFGDRPVHGREPLLWSPCLVLAAAFFIDVQGNRS